MGKDSGDKPLGECLAQLTRSELSPLDFLPDGSLAEKMINLALTGPPRRLSVKLATLFQEIDNRIEGLDTSDLKVVTLGGGTGLSSIIGGDSRRSDWKENPFSGLKEIFPCIHSIVCVTDDGGSTGELLKHLPLVALGDLRHVLLSSIRRQKIKRKYGLDDKDARKLAAQLHAVFNYRFAIRPDSPEALLLATGVEGDGLPGELLTFLRELIERLFSDDRLAETLNHQQCLGNLLLASSIFAQPGMDQSISVLTCSHDIISEATLQGIGKVSSMIGADSQAVLPCTTTSAQLQVLYANGVCVTGEFKSSQARRGYPVDRAMIQFFGRPVLPPQVEKVLREADIIIFAPGSLYTSIIPILQVPGLADLVRSNSRALKILVSNIWVQKGETDAARDAPERKFHVSDLIQAYSRNIPEGVGNLFSHVLTLGLREIPGSVLQSYALEDKEPIYLDRQHLWQMGFEVVEAGIFSGEQLRRRHVIQHDPDSFALAVRTLWCLKKHDFLETDCSAPTISEPRDIPTMTMNDFNHPCERFQAVQSWLGKLTTTLSKNSPDELSQLSLRDRGQLLASVAEIIWHHPDILAGHLDLVKGIGLVDKKHWSRCQEWDNIFSFYEPKSGTIVIRQDQVNNPTRFEMAFLVALGQSLLGNYARSKKMEDILFQGDTIGYVFRLRLYPEKEYQCFFTQEELDMYLRLARMKRSERDPLLYTRMVNRDEGFTPPGLLFGLFYTWYLDNKFASHIEYKMSIMRNTVSDLIPEQQRIVKRRDGLIHFFREKVFRQKQSLMQNRRYHG